MEKTNRKTTTKSKSWLSFKAVIKYVTFAVFLSILFATTVPAASPATWVATTSTGCNSQSNPYSSVEVNGIIYSNYGNISFQSYNPNTGTCTSLSSNGIASSSLSKISNREILGISSASRLSTVYHIPCNLWVVFFPRMIDRSSNACPNSQSGNSQGTGNTITEYQGELFTFPGGGSVNFNKYNPTTNTWTTLATAPATASNGAALTRIGSTIYALRGNNTNDFYSYDITGNTWTNLGSSGNALPTGQNVNQGGALTTDGTYIYAFIGGKNRRFWRYNPAAASGSRWTQMATAPGYVNAGGSLTTMSGKIYALQGNNTRNFWVYNIATNTWNSSGTPAKLNFKVASGGSLTNNGTYVYATIGNARKDFYRYNPANDTWTQLKNIPITIGTSSNTSVQGGMIYSPSLDDIYLVGGTGITGTGSTNLNSTLIVRYALSGTYQDTWPIYKAPSENADATGAGAGLSVTIPGTSTYDPNGDFAYVLLGNASQTLYRYSLLSQNWLFGFRGKISNTEYISNDLWTSTVQSSGNKIAINNGKVYMLAGSTATFLMYDPTLNQWTVLDGIPGTPNNTAALLSYDSDTLYAISNSSILFKYKISTNSWTGPSDSGENDSGETYANENLNAGTSGSSIIDAGGKIYVAEGSNSSQVYAFSPGSNTWESVTTSPSGFNLGSTVTKVQLATDNYDLYYFRGTSGREFYKFNTDSSTWTTLTSLPAGATIPNAGAALHYPGSGDYIYAFTGATTQEFWRYSISGNSWLQLANTPATVRGGGALTSKGSILYALRGNNTGDFWSYDMTQSPGSDSWVTLTSISNVTISAGGSLTTATFNTPTSTDDRIFAMAGNTTRYLLEYNTTTNSWKFLDTISLQVGVSNTASSCQTLTYSESIGDLFGQTCNGGVMNTSTTYGEIFRYKLTSGTYQNEWIYTYGLETNADGLTRGNSMIRIGNDNFFYDLSLNTFRKFYPDTAEWFGFNKPTLSDGRVINIRPRNYSNSGMSTASMAEINGKFYEYSNNAFFNRYDPTTNRWNGMAPLPFTSCGQTAMITINGDTDSIYFIGGQTTCNGGSGNFYKYSVSNNSWTMLAKTPNSTGQPNLAYPGAGDWIYSTAGESPAYASDLWRYSISKDFWVSSHIGRFDGSVGGGVDPTPIAQDTSATYTQSTGNIAIEVNSKVYTLVGNSTAHFRKFDPSNNTWTTLTNFPTNVACGDSLVSDGGNIIYAQCATALYAYCLDTASSCSVNGSTVSANTWTTLAAPPTGSGGGTFGARATGSDVIYYALGGNTQNFYSYCTQPSTGTCINGQTGNTWVARANVPANVYSGGSGTAFGSNTIYALRGNFSTTFYSYNISTNTWTTITSDPAPGTVSNGTGLVTNGTYLYTTRGNGTNIFWRYDPAATAGTRWTTLASLPFIVGDGLSGSHTTLLSIDGDTIWMVTGAGSSTYASASASGKNLLYRYKISTNEWPMYSMPPNGFSNFRKEPLSATGGDSYLYAMSGSFNYTFKRYNITPDRNSLLPDAGSWTTMPSVIDALNNTNGGSLVGDPVNNHIYAIRGANTKSFSRFDPTISRKGRLRAGTNPTTSISTWRLITNGAFNVTIDGVARSISGVNTSAVNSMSDVANVLQTSIRSVTGGNETVSYCNDKYGSYFLFESGTGPGGSSAVSVLSSSFAAAFLTGGTNVNTTLSTWTAITDGSFRISLDTDASPTNVTAINLSSATSMSSVATIIQTRLRAITGRSETVVWSGTRFVITSTTNHPFNSHISVLSSAGTGTDISGATRMDASTNGVVTDVKVDLSGSTDIGSTGNTWTNANSGAADARVTTTIGDWVYCTDSNLPPNTPANFGDNITSGASSGSLKYVPSTAEFWYMNDGASFGNASNGEARLYRYVIDTDNVSPGPQGEWTYAPALATPSSLVAAGGGGWMAQGSSNAIYALGGNNTTNFFKYNIGTNSWSTSTSTPGTVEAGGSLSYDGDHTIYASRGGSTGPTAIWSFNVNDETWNTSLTASPVPIGNTTNDARGNIIYDNGYLWMSPGYGSYNNTPSTRFFLYRYNTGTNTWIGTYPASANTSATGGFAAGSALASLNNDAIYALQGSTSTINPNFWLYTPSTDTWTQKATMPQIGSSTPADVQAGGSIEPGCTSATCSSYDKIFAFRGKATTDFSIYDVANNSWSSNTNQLFPVNVGTTTSTDKRGELEFVPSLNKLYGVSGNSTIYYTIDTNTRLNISSINGGNPVYKNTPFSVTVELVDSSGTPVNATYNTQATIQLAVGTGAIGGTASGTITAGTSSVTISGITYNVADEYNLFIRAADTTSPSNPIPATTSANTALTVLETPAVISNIFPTSGSSNGYTFVTINGSTFLPSDTVSIGGKNVLDLVYSGSNALVIATPPNSVGTNANVVVSRADGAASTAAETFAYSAPNVTSVNPISGTFSGGTPVTLNGDYFTKNYYQKIVQITNGSATNATPTNYQIKIVMDTASLVSASKLQSDCDDMRFFDTDGTTPLNFWIESGCNTASTTFWIKYPSSIPASGSVNIVARYGFPTLHSMSNGKYVFLFFDDFTESNLDISQWTLGTGSTNLSSGRLSVSSSSGLYAGNYLIPHSVIIESNADPQATTRTGGAVRAATSTATGWVADGGANILDIVWKTTNIFAETNSGETSMGAYATGFKKYKITYRPGDADSATFDYNNGALSTTRSGTNAADTLHPVIYSGNGSSLYEDYFIRKYFATEPTVSVGAESGYSVSSSFDGLAATAVSYVSDSQVNATTPAHAIGFVPVSVTNPNGDSGTTPNAYAYTDIFNNANSTVDATPTSVVSDGSDFSNITVTIRNAANVVLPGKTIELYQTAGAITPILKAVDCDTLLPTDESDPIEAVTDSDGEACFQASAYANGQITLTAKNVSESNTNLTDTQDLTFYELPTDPDQSSFTANPDTVEPGESAYLFIQLINTGSAYQEGKTVDIEHNGTDITLTPIQCIGSSGTAGISDEYGNICYQVDSDTIQDVVFTATVIENNVELTAQPTVSFYVTPANFSFSSFNSINNTRTHYIEPINTGSYDYNNYSEYNGTFLRAEVRDDNNVAIDNRDVTLQLSSSLNYIVRSANCSNPRISSAGSVSVTDSYGEACFIVYNTGGNDLNNDLQTTASAIVDNGGGTSITLRQTHTIVSRNLARLLTFAYRYRNDDNNELTASSIETANTPFYNAENNEKFRLRVNLSRNDQYSSYSDYLDHTDEFSPANTADIGPRYIPIGDAPITPHYPAFPSIAYDSSDEKLLVPTSDNPNDQLRMYEFDVNNIGTSPTTFNIPETVNYDTPYSDNIDQPIDGNIEIVSNTFVDNANHLLYMVVTPYFSNATSALVKIYKVDLQTHDVIDVLTEEYTYYPNSTDFLQDSYDAEIDLDHGFMYVTFSGEYPTALEGAPENARVMKIKLNGPTDDMTKVGQLILDQTAELVTSSIIDSTNQFMYVTYGNPQKIVKIDLDVDDTLPPVKVDEILLVPNTDQSPYEKVGFQASVIDTVNGYAYFAGSSDPTLLTDFSASKAFVTKVDIDPTREFEVVSRLQLSSADFASTNSNSGIEFIYSPPPSQNLVPTASIDQVNQYAYFPAAHFNIAGGAIPVYKLARIDLETFTHDTAYDEINYTSGQVFGIKSNLLIPSLGKAFAVRVNLDGDVLGEYNTATHWNFKLQSSPNVDAEYCNIASQSSYNFQDIDNTDFSISSSSHYSDGAPSTNVTGLLPDNADQFVTGELKSTDGDTDLITLGRNNFTELEYTLLTGAGAESSYCLRLADHDVYTNKHQSSTAPDIAMGHFTQDLDQENSNYYIPISISGVTVDPSMVSVIEGTTTASYGIKLNHQPTSNVTINISADDTRIKLMPDATPASPQQTSLTFTNSNWDTFQNITVSAPNNGTVDGTSTGLIHHTASSSDSSFNNIIIRPVNSSVTDYGASTSNVIATIAGDITFTPPADFTFPNVTVTRSTPNFSPNLLVNFNETRGVAADFTLTLQTDPFCISPGTCIPLDKIYLASSDLVNTFNTFTAAQIDQFAANYLQAGESLNDRNTYVHSNSAEDKTLNNTITIFDSRAVPSGNTDNPLQGLIDLSLHLMIDYGNLGTVLQVGTYTTVLTFDFNPNP